MAGSLVRAARRVARVPRRGYGTGRNRCWAMGRTAEGRQAEGAHANHAKLETAVGAVTEGLVAAGSTRAPHDGLRLLKHDLQRHDVAATMSPITVRVASTSLAATPCMLASFAMVDERPLLLASGGLCHQRNRRTTPRTTPRSCTRDVKIGSMLALAGCSRIIPLLSR